MISMDQLLAWSPSYYQADGKTPATTPSTSTTRSTSHSSTSSAPSTSISPATTITTANATAAINDIINGCTTTGLQLGNAIGTSLQVVFVQELDSFAFLAPLFSWQETSSTTTTKTPKKSALKSSVKPTTNTNEESKEESKQEYDLSSSIPKRLQTMTASFTSSSSSSTHSSSSSSSSPPCSKSVSFSDVTIREFPMILGDNPACSAGAPIQLDWDYVDEFTLSLDDATKITSKAKSKSSSTSSNASTGSSSKSSSSTKCVSVTKRAKMLMQAGYSIEEIAEAVMLIEEIKKQRMNSSHSTDMGDRVHLLLRNTGKLPMGLVKGLLKMNKKSSSNSNSSSNSSKQNSVPARSA